MSAPYRNFQTFRSWAKNSVTLVCLELGKLIRFHSEMAALVYPGSFFTKNETMA